MGGGGGREVCLMGLYLGYTLPQIHQVLIAEPSFVEPSFIVNHLSF